MKDEIRVAKRCPICNQRLFDKMSLAKGFVEIKCPNCKHVVRIDLEMRTTRPGIWQPLVSGVHPRW